MDAVKIEQIFSIEEKLDGLSELLKLVVEEGASVGFLPPISQADAADYWQTVLTPEVVLLVANINNQITGTVQLQLSGKQNGSHRAEIAKLMTHQNYRRNGIGRLLIQKAEEIAKQKNRTLIVLDTREGDPSNKLYTSLGYIQAGLIPNYAKSADGELAATIFYYKKLD
ncbi:GNAT family N-acetyltransferase [Mesobacillus harenae]|uniref:GNAT family N-acetyltransferase n=1 Tax=Mesobacillus harenae TaxID=2213203 RepID=UPI001580512F|nr:GNAT family N-acetyltransferase [Mesobacillus harenae]